MIHLLFALLSLAQLAQGTFTNATSTGNCPPPDGTTRTMWGIVVNCALTLLICVWQTIHFDLDASWKDWNTKWVALVLLSFSAPEIIIWNAAQQWRAAHGKVIQFYEKGYNWSMTHSFFAEMGGFVYRDSEGNSRTIYSLEFLQLCEDNKIANPLITVKEIKDRSKSDALGKAILVIQLLWFTLQVIARHQNGLVVTVAEIDTTFMALLSLLVLLFWWNKPRGPTCPHIFYSPQEVKEDPPTNSALSNAWKSEHSHLHTLIACFTRAQKGRLATDEEGTALVGTDTKLTLSIYDRLMTQSDKEEFASNLFAATWGFLGGYHFAAWNSHFPTEVERISWRIASAALVGGPLLLWGIAAYFGGTAAKRAVTLVIALGAFSRAILMVLMVISLRALPCSAYQTVSWVAYIPHLSAMFEHV